jgi:hypothetical protein
MSEEEINLKYEDLMEDYQIDENNLPQKVQQKIQKINELCDEFEQCEEEEEDDLLLQIKALDNGICADLEPICDKIDEEENEKVMLEANKNNPAQNEAQKNTDSEKPSWLFWM